MRRSTAAQWATRWPRTGADRAHLLDWSASAALGGFSVGYQVAVIAGALLSIRRDFGLGAGEQSLLVALLPLGAMFGSLLNSRIVGALGRRRTLILDATLFLAGTALEAVAPGYGVLVVARALLGFTVGSTSSTAPVYLSELAPPHARGRVVSVNQLLTTLGILSAYAVAYAFAGSGSWRAMFAVGAVPALALLLGMLRAPEAPATARAPRRLDLQALLRPALRRPLLVAVALGAIQQFSGINVVIYYAPSIMERAGFGTSNAILAAILVGAVNVAATLLALPLVDRLGRRPLLLASLSGAFVSLALLGLSFVFPHSVGGSRLSLLSMLAFVVAFALGLGPVFWVMIGEIFPARERDAGASVATATNWLSNFTAGVVFLPLVSAAGAGTTFWLFAAACAVGLVFAYRFVPETKGRSLAAVP
ncbi:MAG: sugar porter family transporter [Actinomycetia bacterium]|nr:sugar porter family transporter [Actinomycetes bacterium]